MRPSRAMCERVRRRTAQEERHLAVDHGLLGEVIVDDQRVAAVVAEMLGHRGGGIGREELHRRGLGRGRGHNDGVVDRAGFFELFHKLSNSRTLLADGDIHAVHLFAFVVASSGVNLRLVQHRVEGDSGFTGLTVTNDQLTLATADWDHRVNGLEASCHRLMHRFTRDDARRFDVGDAALGRADGAFAVDGITQTVNNAAQQFVTDWHVHDGVGALDGVAFFDVTVGTEDNNTDVVGFEVQGHALNAAGEFDHFTGLNVVQTIDAGDTVTDGENATHFGHFGFLTEILDLVFQDRRNLCCLDTHLSDLFHYILEGIELGTDRRIDHFRAHFDDKTADEAFINGRMK